MYPCSENKGADQLRSYCEADLRLCFRIGKNPVFSRCGSYALSECNTDTKHNTRSRVAGWKYGPRPLGPKEIDGLLVPPCKAFTLLTDHLITG